MLKRVRIKSEKAGLYLNLKKTRMMSSVVRVELTLGDDLVERVNGFVFLSQRWIWRQDAGKRSKEDKTWKNRNEGTRQSDGDITKATQQYLVKALLLPIATNSCERGIIIG